MNFLVSLKWDYITHTQRDSLILAAILVCEACRDSLICCMFGLILFLTIPRSLVQVIVTCHFLAFPSLSQSFPLMLLSAMRTRRESANRIGKNPSQLPNNYTVCWRSGAIICMKLSETNSWGKVSAYPNTGLQYKVVSCMWNKHRYVANEQSNITVIFIPTFSLKWSWLLLIINLEILKWNYCRTIQNPKGWRHQGIVFNMPANLEDPAVATGLEKINPHPNSQEG